MGAAAAKHGEETATRRTTYALPRVFVAGFLVTSRDERGTWCRLRLGLLQKHAKEDLMVSTHRRVEDEVAGAPHLKPSPRVVRAWRLLLTLPSS